MNITFGVAEQAVIRDTIRRHSVDPYADTLFAGWIHMHQLRRGTFGEEIVAVQLGKMGHTVTKPSHNRYDREVNGIKCEIKTAIKIKGKWNLNHIRKSGEWERLLILLIDTDASVRLVWMHRDDVTASIEGGHFSRQSGGKAGGNDDWKCSNVERLLASNPHHCVSAWNG